MTQDNGSRQSESDLFPWWTSSPFVRKWVFEHRQSAFVSGLVVFLVYWVAPLILTLLFGSIITCATRQELLNLLSAGPEDMFDVPKLLSHLNCMQSVGSVDPLGYLTDKTHFLFAVIISIGAALATHVVRLFDVTMIELRDDGIPRAGDEVLSGSYKYYRGLATHRRFRALSMLLALATLAIFLYITRADGYTYWWGSSKFGYAGYFFSVIAALMVYWGSRAIILIGLGSIMIARIVRFPLILRPYHADGCNGLSPMGRQIILMWMFALSLAFAIYVTLSIGYLGIEKTAVIWIIALLASLTIPALAILPLISALSSIREAQKTRLANFETLLHGLLDQAEQHALQSDPDATGECVEKLKNLQEAQAIILSANVWPFNPKALVGILIVNTVQITLTANELFGIFQ